jgi:hypothetical protein
MQMSHCPGVEPVALRTVRRLLIVLRWVTVMGYCLPPPVDRFVDPRAG